MDKWLMKEADGEGQGARGRGGQERKYEGG